MACTIVADLAQFVAFAGRSAVILLSIYFGILRPVLEQRAKREGFRRSLGSGVKWLVGDRLGCVLAAVCFGACDLLFEA